MMKHFKYYALLLLTAVTIFGCSEYDDTELKKDVNDLKSRVENLEAWCKTANNQISALQGLVDALETNDYVTGVSPILEGSKEVGYTITFAKSASITIMQGKDGLDGKDGVDGNDGTTPVIGVELGADGYYYWTIQIGDGEATLIKDPATGKGIRASGDKGENGEKGDKGENGHTPELTVEADTDGVLYWKIDGEWLLQNGNKVRVTGDTGATGPKGDAVFAEGGIDTSNSDYVEFKLADGTVFRLKRTGEMQIFDTFDTFIVSPVLNEIVLALPATMKETDYTAIKAEITSSQGMGIDIKTRASSTPWNVEIIKPVFTNGTIVEGSAKVQITPPAGIVEGEIALLKVTIIDNNAQERAATRVLEYSGRVSVTGVTLEEKVSIPERKSVKLIPVIIPESANNKNVTWESSNESVARVSDDGTVTAIAMGKAIITVKTEDGNKTATCEVTVTEALAMLVGDYFYADGTFSSDYTDNAENPCLGIVVHVGRYETDECEYKLKGTETTMTDINGYVLALYDADEGNTYTWGLNTVAIGTGPSPDDKTDFNGYMNTQKIKDYASDNGNNLQTDFPATYWATDGYEATHAAPVNSSGWFLPSCGQCNAWYDNEEKILMAIKNTTGNNDYAWGNYWSSTEILRGPAGGAMDLEFVTEYDPGVSYNPKGTSERVRPFLVF